jgi:phage gp36-like protein
MSRYIQFNDVSNKFPDFPRAGGTQETMVAFINAAEDEVDAALAGIYTVPFTPCPGMVLDLCKDLAYYKANWRTKEAQILKDYIDSRISNLQTLKSTLVVSGTLLSDNPPAVMINPTPSFVPIDYATSNGSSSLFGDNPLDGTLWP